MSILPSGLRRTVRAALDKALDFTRLRRAPAGGGHFVAALAPALPSSEVIHARYAGAAGARAYRLYVPSRPAPARDSRLVVMLHGCTQNADDFALGAHMDAVAEQRGWHVLYPAQSKAANFTRCWNWFSPDHQTRERGEPAIIAAMTREVMAKRDIRAASVAGLSAGGAMALTLGEVHPELFDTVLSHSGVAYAAARDIPSAMIAMKDGASPLPARPYGPRLMIVQGMDDATVSPRNADVIENAVETAGAPRVSRETKNARAVERRVVAGADGRDRMLSLRVAGLGHAWSGGTPGGSFVDPLGPDVSEEFARFVER